MEKKPVTIYSQDKALAYIKETSGGHSDMFIRDTAFSGVRIINPLKQDLLPTLSLIINH